MDTNAPKTPATLPFAAWQSMSPEDAAREVKTRVAALPDPLRKAALAWLRPETELAHALGHAVNSTLHGVPYLLKDLFDLAGVSTKAGSTFLAKVRPLPSHDCALAQALARHGAVCAGKTHLVEFASGLTGENPHYGDCPHPRFPDRLSGGSSSGSAALVAAGVAPLAIGTDTGGSVRVPAAWCGLYGFRLSPGDEFIRDAFPLAPSMDTAGWFTAHAEDMLTAITALVGSPAPAERTPRGAYLDARKLVPGIDPEVWAACEQAARRIATPVDAGAAADLLAAWQQAVDAYLTIGMSEAHAVHRDWLAPYHEHYDPVVWQRFTDAGQIAADKIAAARQTMSAIRQQWDQFFAGFDFLVLPAVPCVAPRKAEATPELRRNILRLTAPASLGGNPVLSLPVTLRSGLTAGLQVVLSAADSAAVPWLLKAH